MAEDLSVLNVAELKERLRAAGLPVSGKKEDLIARLNDAARPMMAREPTEPTPAEDFEGTVTLGRKDAALAMMRRESVLGLPLGAVVAILLAAMMTTVALAAPGLLGFAKEPDWELIDFDATQAEAFAAGLVALGHPEWKGRMSGSAYEHAAAESILENFSSMGYQTQMHTYPVDMFSVNSEPSLRMCLQGLGGNSPC